MDGRCPNWFALKMPSHRNLAAIAIDGEKMPHKRITDADFEFRSHDKFRNSLNGTCDRVRDFHGDHDRSSRNIDWRSKDSTMRGR